MLTMPNIVSAISESSVPLGCTLRTDIMPLPRAPASLLLVPQDEQSNRPGANARDAVLVGEEAQVIRLTKG